MPLKEGAVNQILPFAPEGIEAADDIWPLEKYAETILRKRGHQPGVAERGVQNRANRQALHMAAGLAQFIANRHAPGVIDDGDLDKVEAGLLEVITALIAAAIPPAPEKYELCEFYGFRHPDPLAGFYPRTGGTIADAALRHPEAWEKLKTSWGQKLCLTEAKWLEMNTATWATLADGTKVGWNGIGGVPFFAPDWNTGALRLPDTRGMYAEDAGFDALGVGDVHGDGGRNATGTSAYSPNNGYIRNSDGIGTGVFRLGDIVRPQGVLGDLNQRSVDLIFDLSRVMPVAAKFQTRAWGALACVYLGLPQS